MIIAWDASTDTKFNNLTFASFSLSKMASSPPWRVVFSHFSDKCLTMRLNCLLFFVHWREARCMKNQHLLQVFNLLGFIIITTVTAISVGSPRSGPSAHGHANNAHAHKAGFSGVSDAASINYRMQRDSTTSARFNHK
jgi:hypothetical protein